MNRQSDGRTCTPSYTDAKKHLEREKENDRQSGREEKTEREMLWAFWVLHGCHSLRVSSFVALDSI